MSLCLSITALQPHVIRVTNQCGICFTLPKLWSVGVSREARTVADNQSDEVSTCCIKSYLMCCCISMMYNKSPDVLLCFVGCHTKVHKDHLDKNEEFVGYCKGKVCKVKTVEVRK